jgi:endoglucanase
MSNRKTLPLISAIAILVLGSFCMAAEPPQIEHVGMVAPDILAITITAGRAEYGRQVPYTKAAGDTVAESDIHRFVWRGGKVIGTQIGQAGDLLCTMDEVIGERFDTAWADKPASYAITSDNDTRYSSTQQPAAVYRKSKPSDLAMIGVYKFDSPTENYLYLKLPAPLEVGKKYVVSFPNSPLPAQTFTFDPATQRSEAVHVNQIGFRPDDPAKVAFLSCWMGSGGGLDYKSGLPFTVIDDQTGQSVFEGATTLSKAASDKTEDAYKKNYNGTDVYMMDFTAVAKPGRYRVSVKGIGCSYPFEVRDDVWRKAFIVSARGFYHQRSGIALGPPYTSFTRPRTFHPDDGLKVFASKTPFIDTGNGLNNKDSNFGNLVKGKSDQIVPNAWGGYMDAGDWDRRVQHLRVSMLLLELADLFPDYFAAVSLNIPESGNGLPDVVNEALFNIDFFRRLQLPDGGIRGGIESSEHPRRGEASFQESLTVMAYAPDSFSSYMYAGVAARAARCLAPKFPDRAAVYRGSATKAMQWAETDLPREEKEFLMAKHPAVRDVRSYAAAEMFALTGDARWNKLFEETTLFQKPGVAVPWNWDSLDQADSAWVYARTDKPGMNQQIKDNCRAAVLTEADARLASVDRTAFHWAKHLYGPVVYGALSSPEYGVNAVRAHVLTGDAKYLRAVVLASQTGAGANPVNMCYTTGLGQKWPQHPLQIDHRITHQSPPPGITVGGPMDNTIKDMKDIFIRQFAGTVVYPEVEKWPALDAFWDVFWDPMVCEYTVHKPMAGNAFVWGYLAARGK